MKFTIVASTDELFNTYKSFKKLINPRDSGFDLIIPKDIVVKSNTKQIIDFEVKAFLVGPEFCVLQIVKNLRKKSCAFKKFHSFILVPNFNIGTKTPLIVNITLFDSTFTDNIKVVVFNYSNEDFTLEKGERFFQLTKPNFKSLGKYKIVKKFKRNLCNLDIY